MRACGWLPIEKSPITLICRRRWLAECMIAVLAASLSGVIRRLPHTRLWDTASPSIYQRVCPAFYGHVSLSVCLHGCPSLSTPVCVSVCVYVHFSLSIYIYLCMCLCTYLSIYLSIDISFLIYYFGTRLCQEGAFLRRHKHQNQSIFPPNAVKSEEEKS